MAASNDLRRLRWVDQDRGWTLRTPKEASAHLCRICVHEGGCDIQRRHARLQAKVPVALEITNCPHYSLAIPFRRPLIGLEGVFNTFRLGAAWATKYVAIDMQVALWDSQDNQKIGVALVRGIDLGPYDEVAAKYAHLNHTQLALRPEDAPDALFKVMQRSYGTTFMTRNRVCSVISLRRLG